MLIQVHCQRIKIHTIKIHQKISIVCLKKKKNRKWFFILFLSTLTPYRIEVDEGSLGYVW